MEINAIKRARVDVQKQADAILSRVENENRDVNADEDRKLTELYGRLVDLDARAKEANDLEERAKLADTVRDQYARIIAADPELSQGFTSPGGNVYRYAESMFGTEFRSVLTSTSSNTFTTTQRMDDLWPTLAAESVFLSTGPQRFQTDSTQFAIPAGTAFATASWKAEGGTASASDAGYKLVTITPDVLMTVSEFSTEAAEDNPYLLDAAAGEIFRQFGRKIDAAFLDAGNSSHISALHGNAGAGTVAAGGALTDLDPFVAAAGSAMAQGVPYSRLVYVVGPSTWQALGTAHIGATEDVRPLLTTSANAGGGAAIADNRLLGRPMFVSSDLTVTGGTAYALVYDPSQIAVVTRKEFTVLVDPVTKADAGITRIVASLRIGGAAVNSKAVAEIGGIVP